VPTSVDLERLQELLASGAQLVEVLPKGEYEEEHLPGAINLPLRRIEHEAHDLLDRHRPVVVYCFDSA
jgi:rhodanese-related sulfurtransferase